MTKRITFSIPGEPKGKQRAQPTGRIVWQNGEPRCFVSMSAGKESAKLEKVILELFRSKFPGHEPWTGAVLLRFTAVFETPKSFNRALKDAAARGELYCTKKPDKDNIEKLICDALTPPRQKNGSPVPVSSAGYAWVEDAQVMGGGIKRYGSPARTDVTLELLDSGDAPATPGRKRAEARVAAEKEGRAVRPVRANRTKSGTKSEPDRLRLAIDAALDRDARLSQAQRAFFGEDE